MTEKQTDEKLSAAEDLLARAHTVMACAGVGPTLCDEIADHLDWPKVANPEAPMPLRERIMQEAKRRGSLPSELIGSWPGDETDEELLAALEELK